MRRLRHATAGFTIIELMAVVVVVGVLGALALPSFKSLMQGQQVKNASFDLYSSLVLARSEAIKRNDNVVFNIVSYGGGKIGWTVSAGAETLRAQGMVNGVVWTLTPNDTTSVTYTRTGRATTAPTFQIDISATATSNVRCVKVGLSGMPQTIKGACS